MRFDFACFALCEMTIEDDTDLDLHEVDATLLSFHASVRDAVAEQIHVTELQRAAYRLRFKCAAFFVPKFAEPQYQIVPIQQMRFDDLSDAQEMIEQAAVLQQKGVGI